MADATSSSERPSAPRSATKSATAVESKRRSRSRYQRYFLKISGPEKPVSDRSFFARAAVRAGAGAAPGEDDDDAAEAAEPAAAGEAVAPRKTALSASTTRLFLSTVRSRCALGELARLATFITAAPSERSA